MQLRNGSAQVHTSHPNISLKRARRSGRAADARRRRVLKSRTARLLCKLQRTIPYKIELGVVR